MQTGQAASVIASLRRPPGPVEPRILNAPDCAVLSLDDRLARTVGALLGTADTADIVDAAVVITAREHDARIMTADVDDMRRLDPGPSLIAC